MKITNIKIKKLEDENSRCKGIVTVILNDCLAIHNIRIIEGPERIFIAMPAQKSDNGNYYDYVHPITTDFRNTLESAILTKYNEL